MGAAARSRLIGQDVVSDRARSKSQAPGRCGNWEPSIVGEFLKGRPLVELYDSVLIPALSLAEQDRHKGAIDSAREEFLFLSINEMIAEFSEYQLADSSPAEDPASLPDAAERAERQDPLSSGP